MPEPSNVVELAVCNACRDPALCRAFHVCKLGAIAKENSETPLYVGKTPEAFVEKQRRKSDFTGYLLIGGPLDGLFVQHAPGRMVLASSPRPGMQPRAAESSAALDEYQADFVDGFRYYRHRTIGRRQALNRLLLWYLPPDPYPVAIGADDGKTIEHEP